METVRVDLRKLQILNERINQTIDALGQLRQSVHAFQPAFGMQHSTGAQFGYGTPYGAPVGWPQPAQIPQPGVAQPYGMPQAAFGVQQNPWVGQPGLSHSNFGGIEASPWGRFADPSNGFRAQQQQQQYPWAFSGMSPVIGL